MDATEGVRHHVDLLASFQCGTAYQFRRDLRPRLQRFTAWTRGKAAVEPQQPMNGRAWRLPESNVGHVDGHALEISPADVVSRRASTWVGIKVEVVQSVTHDKVEFRFRAPCHLLLVYEEGVRDEGETAVGGQPASTLRTLRRKLTFVPAGHDYCEWQRPRVRSRIICFYFDPAKLPIHSDASPTAALPSGSSVSSPPISKSTSPSRFHSMCWRSWFI